MPGIFDLSSDEGASETGSVSEPELLAARPKRQKKRVQATETERGFSKLKLLAICSLSNQPMY